MQTIDYLVDRMITAHEFIDVLNRSGLGLRRPVHDVLCIQGMLDHSNLLVTAHCEDKVVGVARSVTDFHYCCYLSDLAVDQAFQKQGIGKHLIRLSRSQLGKHCTIILLSAPAAVDYYPHMGFEHHPQSWVLKPGQPLA